MCYEIVFFDKLQLYALRMSVAYFVGSVILCVKAGNYVTF